MNHLPIELQIQILDLISVLKNIIIGEQINFYVKQRVQDYNQNGLNKLYQCFAGLSDYVDQNRVDFV